MTNLQLSRIGIVLGGRVDLDLNAAEIRIREARAGIVGDQVLGAQLITDLAKGGVELLQAAGIEVLAPGIPRKLDERVFPANVAASAVFDGHNDDAVQNDFRLLRLAYGFLVIRLADGIAAVGNDHHHFAAAAVKQRVVQRSRRPRVDVVDGAIDHLHVGSKRRNLVDNLAELEQRNAVDGAQNSM